MSDYGDDDEDFGDIDEEALTLLATQVENQHRRQASPDEFDDSILDNIDDDDIVEITGSALPSSVNIGSSAPKRPQQYNLFGQRLPPSDDRNQHILPPGPEKPTHHQLDMEAIRTWIYPTNVQHRDYQFNICSKSLLSNVLVALPTGLGKTFIAAVVMLNWYRWAPNSQIAFLAPTKPLVQQQIEACINLVGIPRRETAEISGEIRATLRQEYWSERRVFFCTPHTMLNDISSGRCDPKRIVCVVVDEAHKATGNYASADLIRKLRGFNESFRVLALSATPGSTTGAVQDVIDNLGISKIELRTDQSIDIVQYINTKNIHLEELELPPEVEEIIDLYCKCLEPQLKKLTSAGVYWQTDPRQLTSFGLLEASNRFRNSDEGRRMQQNNQQGRFWGLVRAFTNLQSLAHNLELLTVHGLRLFHKKMIDPPLDDKAGSASEKALKSIRNEDTFRELMDTTEQLIADPNFYGHPKMDYMINAILKHFTEAEDMDDKRSTRIIVFSEFRDSTNEIVRYLDRHRPLIRPSAFIGQAAGRDHKGMTQKEQGEVMRKFREGEFNALVCTSIGEEGLDIGEVDLIVMYDCKKSPIRLLQRMGRTGRKRNGAVIVLLTAGKEAKNYHSAQDNYKRMQEYIANKSQFKMRDDISKRIIPKEITPAVDKQLITIPPENLEPAPPRGRGPKKKQPKLTKNFFMPADAKSGFTTASRLGKDDDSDLDMNDIISRKRAAADEPPAEFTGDREDVLLTSEEHENLVRSYARTFASGEEVVIGPPSLDAFPRSQRRLTEIYQVKHSRRTIKTVNMIARMRGIKEETIAAMEKMVDDRLCKSPPKTTAFKPVKPTKGLFGGLEKKTTGKPLGKTTGNTPSPKKPGRKILAKRSATSSKAKNPIILMDSSDSDEIDEDEEEPPRRNSKKRLGSGGGSRELKRQKMAVYSDDGNEMKEDDRDESDPFDTLKSSDSELPDVFTLIQSGGFQSAKSMMKKR